MNSLCAILPPTSEGTDDCERLSFGIVGGSSIIGKNTRDDFAASAHVQSISPYFCQIILYFPTDLVQIRPKRARQVARSVSRVELNEERRVSKSGTLRHAKRNVERDEPSKGGQAAKRRASLLKDKRFVERQTESGERRRARGMRANLVPQVPTERFDN